MSKPITDMSREEILAEIAHLQSIPVPKGPVAKAPPKPQKSPKANKRAKWKDDLGL